MEISGSVVTLWQIRLAFSLLFHLEISYDCLHPPDRSSIKIVNVALFNVLYMVLVLVLVLPAGTGEASKIPLIDFRAGIVWKPCWFMMIDDDNSGDNDETIILLLHDDDDSCDNDETI